MATPDVRDLYERYLQLLGGPSSSPEPTQSQPRAQSPRSAYELPSDAYQAEDYRPTGGVLGGLASPSPGIPRWAQALSPRGGAAVGPPGLSPASRLRPWGGIPMPTGRDGVVEIPNPHIERSIPQSTRDFWNAIALTHQFFRGQWLGDKASSRDTEDSGASSSKIPPEQQPNRPGSQEPWIVGPAILKEELERQGGMSSQGQRAKGNVDPDFRRLTRVPPIGLGSEGDNIASSGAAQSSGDGDGKSSRGVPSPPLVPDQEPPANYPDAGASGSGLGGGFGGGVKSGGNDNERRRECVQDWQDEKNDWCRQFRFVDPVYERICKEIADVRLDQCYRNEAQRDKFSMKEVDPEDVKKFLARQRETESKRSTKSKKRR